MNDTYLLLMAEERGIQGAAIFFSIMTGMKLVSSVGMGALADAFGVKIPLAFACIATIAAAFLLGSSTNIGMIILAAVLYAIAKNGSQPMLQKAATEVAPREKRGAAISTNYFIYDCASTFGGYICAFLYSALGYGGTYYAVSIFPAIGLLWMLVAYRNKKPADTEKAEN